MDRSYLLLPLVLLLSAGCSQGASKARSAPAARTATRSPTCPSSPLPDNDPRILRFHRVDMLVTQWDVAQSEGRVDQARALHAQIRTEVDAAFQDFAEASRGRQSLEMQYLATSALGFSATPQATQVLLERLADTDARLVGNALIALKIRADPATPMAPLLKHVQNRARDPRRYAPLAVANVAEARQRSGRSIEPEMQRAAAHVLSGVVADRDPFVRLHTAKALGAVRSPGCYELLMILIEDDEVRVRLAAAAGLERTGDPRGFPAVIRLLHGSPDEAKTLLQDVLATYAGHIQGRPLSPAELQRFGTSPLSWQQWFNSYRARTGLDIEGEAAPRSTTGPAVPPPPRPATRGPASPTWSAPAPPPRPAPLPPRAPSAFPPPQVR